MKQVRTLVQAIALGVIVPAVAIGVIAPWAAESWTAWVCLVGSCAVPWVGGGAVVALEAR